MGQGGLVRGRSGVGRTKEEQDLNNNLEETLGHLFLQLAFPLWTPVALLLKREQEVDQTDSSGRAGPVIRSPVLQPQQCGRKADALPEECESSHGHGCPRLAPTLPGPPPGVPSTRAG